MRNLTLLTLLFATAIPAWAHPGHNAMPVHLHWWEYGVLAALVAGALTYAARK